MYIIFWSSASVNYPLFFVQGLLDVIDVMGEAVHEIVTRLLSLLKLAKCETCHRMYNLNTRVPLERKCEHPKTICASCDLDKENFCTICRPSDMKNSWKIDDKRQSLLKDLLAYDVHVITGEFRGRIIDALEINHSINILPELQAIVEKFVDSVFKVPGCDEFALVVRVFLSDLRTLHVSLKVKERLQHFVPTELLAGLQGLTLMVKTVAAEQYISDDDHTTDDSSQDDMNERWRGKRCSFGWRGNDAHMDREQENYAHMDGEQGNDAHVDGIQTNETQLDGIHNILPSENCLDVLLVVFICFPVMACGISLCRHSYP